METQARVTTNTFSRTMRDGNDRTKLAGALTREECVADKPLPPAWRAFVRYCAELQHGEIETLKIQDGLPVLAEVVKKKVKFAS
jgi:hypothetical protein